MIDADNDNTDDDNTVDPLPRGADLLPPAHWLSWSVAFVEGWIFSRESRRLLIGLPFVAATLTGGGFLWWLQNSPDSIVIAQLEKILASAYAADDLTRVENGLHALVNLRPTEPEYRFRLGQFLVEQDRPEGIPQILALAPDQNIGYAPARLWLVQQALSPTPRLKLTDQQIEGQLLKILQQLPKHGGTHRLLAELYLRQSEWTLAESFLTSALPEYPVLAVPLARVKRILERPAEDIQALLESGAEVLRQRLAKDRSDVPIRIALAETLSLLGQHSEARTLLMSGAQQEDGDEKLRTALSDFDLQWAAQKLTDSVFNMEVCLQTVLDVISRQPGHPGIVVELPRLKSAGATITRQQIEPSLEYWTAASQNPELNETERQQAVLGLAQLLSIVDEFERAADALRPLMKDRPALRLSVAKLLAQTSSTEEARALAEEIASEQQAILVTSPDNEAAFEQFLAARQLLDEPQDLIQRVAAWCDSQQKSPADLLPGAQAIYGTAMLATARQLEHQLTSAPAADITERSKVLVGHIWQAAHLPAARQSAIDYLARLRFSDSPAASLAAEKLRLLRVGGDRDGNILLTQGTHAILAGQYEEAAQLLETASIQVRHKNVGILNNLAIALVRSAKPQPEIAMHYIALAEQLAPDQFELKSTRGEVLIASQKWSEARVLLEEVLPRRRNSPTVHRLLARVYEELGEQAMAMAHQQRLKELTER